MSDEQKCIGKLKQNPHRNLLPSHQTIRFEGGGEDGLPPPYAMNLAMNIFENSVQQEKPFQMTPILPMV